MVDTDLILLWSAARGHVFGHGAVAARFKKQLNKCIDLYVAYWVTKTGESTTLLDG